MSSIEIAGQRALGRVVVTPFGCWDWRGARHPSGYGNAVLPRAEGRQRFIFAHRLVWTFLVGEIPAGMDLDHLCRNRACVNPDHLDPVSHRENLLRGSGFAATNIRKTHCSRGHELTPQNTYVRPSRRGRDCRTCRAARRRAHYGKEVRRA